MKQVNVRKPIGLKKPPVHLNILFGVVSDGIFEICSITYYVMSKIIFTLAAVFNGLINIPQRPSGMARKSIFITIDPVIMN